MKRLCKAFKFIGITIPALSGCTQIRVKENSFETSWTFDEHSHWHACTDKGYEDLISDEAEHTFKEEVVPPTSKEEGYTLHTCETCGYQYKDNETGVLTEHNYSSEWSSDEKNHWHACTDKGYEDLISDEAEHTLSDEWIIDKEPSTTEQGTKYKKCTVCGRRLVEETIDIIPDEVDDSNLIFTQLDSGTYSVKAASKSVEEVVIPSKYNGKPVTTIEKNAFYNCASLTSITIPDSVTLIGDAAFSYCTSLSLITIPKSVTSIAKNAFTYCSSLTSIIIPKSVTSIGEHAFNHCTSLTSITIPSSVSSIGKFAFCDCSSLTSITIPNGVTSIGGYVFYNCSSLKSIIIPNSVTSIGIFAFRCCTSLQTINFDGTSAQWNAISKGEGWNNETPTSMVINCVDDLNIDDPNLIFTELDSGNYSVKAASQSVEEVVIPTKYNGKLVTMIENNAFFNCHSLTSITIPNTVTFIGECAFASCPSLTSISIPDSVTLIGDDAFLNCSSLTSVTIPNSVTSIGFAPFSWCPSLQTIIFGGTKEQWYAINNGFDWWTERSATTSLVIHCCDGDINYL